MAKEVKKTPIMKAREKVFQGLIDTRKSRQFDTEADREMQLQHLRGWRDCTEFILGEMHG